MMTREEYTEMSLEYLSESQVFSCGTFPELLLVAGRELFMIGDTSSEFAIETKRRIQQLNEEGFTDD